MRPYVPLEAYHPRASFARLQRGNTPYCTTYDHMLTCAAIIYQMLVLVESQHGDNQPTTYGLREIASDGIPVGWTCVTTLQSTHSL